MQYGGKTYWSYAASLLLLSGVIYYWTRSEVVLYVMAGLVLLLLIPTTGVVLTASWQKITLFIGKVNGIILLTLVFFLILAPIGIVRRIFGVDELGIKKDESRESYFVEHEGEFDLEGAERVW